MQEPTQPDEPEVGLSKGAVSQLSIRPFARLLTMLGEQLIKNDRVALAELLKNCYDADATVAKVIFSNFDHELHPLHDARLVLVDDGDGMTEEVVREHWLNPATAIKAQQKLSSPVTTMNRTIQGEKGIGRFAMFKLGSAATIVTRAREANHELVLEYDLSFLDAQTEQPQQYLDEIRVELTRRTPLVFDGSNPAGGVSSHGTRIEVRNLRGSWSRNAAQRAFDDVARLLPLIPARDFEAPEPGYEFKVEFWQDDVELPFQSNFAHRLRQLFDDRAVLRVTGIVDAALSEVVLEVNGETRTLDVFGVELGALRIHKQYLASRADRNDADGLACGPFSFSFFVFDFSSTCPPQHFLDSQDKALVKEHRVYLYRDGVRVLPYGDPSDDWLQLDVVRGTQGASRILGNDQTVGFVHITHADNPKLNDKTNREGLLDEGNAYGDFVAVLQSLAAYIRATPYARYVRGKERRREATLRRGSDTPDLLTALHDDPNMPKKLKPRVEEIRRSMLAYREHQAMRIERTEDLASVGMSVESASHDILAAGDQALHIARSMLAHVEERMPKNEFMRTRLTNLSELVSFVLSRLNDIQGLFVSTRQRRTRRDVTSFAERVGRMFAFALERSQIEYSISQPTGSLVVRSTEAALLQTLMNLVDNAIYWANLGDIEGRRILVQIEADENRLIVADTGPGVDEDDIPFIFEPFYSSKGVDGKGLGLYIARQVGARNGFTVTLDQDLALLPGANFVVTFDDIEAGVN